jgi:CDP-diacylglycerol--glycerol-3-phosphate 3-phosphatidyltransferase
VLDVKARDGAGRVVRPIIRLLHRLHITATAVTVAGLLVTIAGAGLLAAGHFVAGALVAGFGSALDILDGPLARATGSVSKRGAFIDTVADRLGEAAIWAGVGYAVAGDRRLVVLVVAGAALSMLVPFVRSKAEAAGVEGRGGLMGRAERLILLLAGVGFHGFDIVDTLEPTLWAVVVLAGLTASQRMYRTLAQLDG